MVDVINYIFGSLQASSIMVEIHSYGQDKKIEELGDEIKRMKGE